MRRWGYDYDLASDGEEATSHTCNARSGGGVGGRYAPSQRLAGGVVRVDGGCRIHPVRTRTGQERSAVLVHDADRRAVRAADRLAGQPLADRARHQGGGVDVGRANAEGGTGQRTG